MLGFKERKTLYNLCDPAESLLPNDPRNVNIDARPGEHVRGVNWVDRLTQLIELTDRPVRALFSGLPGSGKSTELRRLAAQLADPHGADLLPVIADAQQMLDLSSRIDVPDVLATLLFATEQEVLALENRDPNAAMQETAIGRLWHWLTTTDLSFKQGTLMMPPTANLVLEMKDRPSLRARVRETVGANLPRFLEEVRKEFVALEARARAQGRTGLLVILDSLEKLHGTSTTWEEVLNSAEVVFSTPYLDLPVHVLYTVPPALFSRRVVDGAVFMPMIKLRTIDGAVFPPGVEAARALIEHRVDRDTLCRMLGASTCDARIERLINWSGGYPRELVRVLRSLVRESSHDLSDGDFERILQEESDAICRVVPDYAFEWLARVAVEQRLVLDQEEQRQTVERMVQNNVVLRYQNLREWFDVHPAVRSLPAVRDAIARLPRKVP